MKTLIIYNPIEFFIRYAIVDGDYSHLNGITINACEEDPEKEAEAISLLFMPDSGGSRIDMSDDVSVIEGKQWDKVALITLLP